MGVGRSMALAAGMWTVALGCSDGRATVPAGGRDAEAAQAGDAAAGADAGLDAAAVDAAAVDATVDAGTDAATAPFQPTNLSFDTALLVEPDSQPVLQTVYSATQADFYAFDGNEGDYFALATDVNDFSPDTVIKLYDPDRQLIAENDSGSMWPGDAIDARLVVRLPRSGRYYARVQDPAIPPDYFNSAFSLIYYHFTLKALLPGTPGVAIKQGEGPTPVEFATDAASGYAYATVVGSFAPDQTEELTFSGLHAQVLVGHVLPAGVPGNGSSAGYTDLRVETSAGQPLAEILGSMGQEYFHPPITDGDYRVKLTTQSELGDNGFYAIDLVQLPDNPPELSDTDNNQLVGAQIIDMQGSFSRRGLLLSTLPPDDVDYYRFDAKAGEQITVACEGQSGGSGVRGLLAELRDASDAVLVSAPQTQQGDINLNGFGVTADAPYYLRLSSQTKPSGGAPEPWTRCVVIAAP